MIKKKRRKLIDESLTKKNMMRRLLLGSILGTQRAGQLKGSMKKTIRRPIGTEIGRGRTVRIVCERLSNQEEN